MCPRGCNVILFLSHVAQNKRKLGRYFVVTDWGGHFGVALNIRYMYIFTTNGYWILRHKKGIHNLHLIARPDLYQMELFECAQMNV